MRQAGYRSAAPRGRAGWAHFGPASGQWSDNLAPAGAQALAVVVLTNLGQIDVDPLVPAQRIADAFLA